ncbi:hypothetical protein E4U55_000866 [Claviceps digitariae]|nr:hypothetical protein E4U55_000866 [Claviceps digitariae]
MFVVMDNGSSTFVTGDHVQRWRLRLSLSKALHSAGPAGSNPEADSRPGVPWEEEGREEGRQSCICPMTQDTSAEISDMFRVKRKQSSLEQLLNFQNRRGRNRSLMTRR